MSDSDTEKKRPPLWSVLGSSLFGAFWGFVMGVLGIALCLLIVHPAGGDFLYWEKVCRVVGALLGTLGVAAGREAGYRLYQECRFALLVYMAWAGYILCGFLAVGYLNGIRY